MRWSRNAARSIRPRTHPLSTAVSLLAVVGLVTGGFMAAATPAGAVPVWSIKPSPSPFRANPTTMAAVSCSSPTSCFAVGARSYVRDYPGVTHIESAKTVVVEQWNGTAWTDTTAPAPPAAALHAVSCTSATNCVAVGDLSTVGIIASNATLIESWNGTSWSIVTSPNPSGAESLVLNGVSCTSATNCFAVGSYTASGTTHTLIERWDGLNWTIVASPDPSGAINADLSGVSCPTATSCYAVGGEIDGPNLGAALVEQWDGVNWTVVSTPAPTIRAVVAPQVTPRLNGISCTSDTNCIAVGFTASDALIEQWNGTSWSLVSSPVPAVHSGIADLRSVSCAAATDCWAVGVSIDTSLAAQGKAIPNSIAEHWNGTTWSVAPRPPLVPINKVSVAQLGELSGVSCTAATSCAAVGDSSRPERWNGSAWSLAPVAATTSLSYLNAASCPSVTRCFAVGTAVAPLDEGNQALVERWTGTNWAILPSATPSGTNVHATLTSISCPAPANCFAVGGYDFTSLANPNLAHGKALIERWNGTKWSILPGPTPLNATFWTLRSVSCISVKYCNAVGNYTTSSGSHLLMEHWNGAQWSVVKIPSPSRAVLNGVSCATDRRCFAVGSYFASGKTRTLIEQWNGLSWKVVLSATPKVGMIAQLNAVTCRTAVDCKAVGNNHGPTSASYRTVIVHWNGKTWVSKPSPSPTGPVNLTSVSCTNAASCTAVGSYAGVYPYFNSSQPLVEHWNGTAWSVLAAPSPAGATGTFLIGTACTRTQTCFAVGGHNGPPGALHTFVEKRH